MSLRPDNTLITNSEMFSELVLAPFRGFVRLIENTANKNARTLALRAVADMTDAELRAKGLTRAEAASILMHHDV